MSLKKEKKNARKSIIKGMHLQAKARDEYNNEVKRLEKLHKERLDLAYEVFNNSMTDIGYTLAFIEMKSGVNYPALKCEAFRIGLVKEYPEMWL